MVLSTVPLATCTRRWTLACSGGHFAWGESRSGHIQSVLGNTYTYNIILNTGKLRVKRRNIHEYCTNRTLASRMPSYKPLEKKPVGITWNHKLHASNQLFGWQIFYLAFNPVAVANQGRQPVLLWDNTSSVQQLELSIEYHLWTFLPSKQWVLGQTFAAVVRGPPAAKIRPSTISTSPIHRWSQRSTYSWSWATHHKIQPTC